MLCGQICVVHLFGSMATDLLAQMEAQFFKARDEYIAAIRTQADALAAALKTEAVDVNAEYERAASELGRKQEAYRRATDDLRALNVRQS